MLAGSHARSLGGLVRTHPAGSIANIVSSAALGLAGTSTDPVGPGTTRRRTVDLAGRGRLGVREVGQRSLAHAAQRLARRLLATRLLVGRRIEGDEENKVRAENGDTGERSKLLAGASASVGHEREIGRGEVCVRGKVDEAYNEACKRVRPLEQMQCFLHLPRSIINWTI